MWKTLSLNTTGATAHRISLTTRISWPSETSRRHVPAVLAVPQRVIRMKRELPFRRTLREPQILPCRLLMPILSPDLFLNPRLGPPCLVLIQTIRIRHS